MDVNIWQVGTKVPSMGVYKSCHTCLCIPDLIHLGGLSETCVHHLSIHCLINALIIATCTQWFGEVVITATGCN